ncbi:hypothetical protein ACFSQJ_04045 [Croceitalea marina]|uniref:ApeA N-terminal domain-containing protein n=1 Tax=Croceitalea marina TaxID=1775166 RepID=A0ABW5MTH7_9FLAO
MKNLKTKYFNPTLDLIEILNQDQTFTIVAIDHHLDGCSLELKKSDGEFSFETISPLVGGLQNHKEIQFERSDSLKFVNENRTLHLQGKDYLANDIGYLEHDSKYSKGTISSFSTNVITNDSKEVLLRYVVPVGEKNKLDLRDFKKTLFQVGNGTSLLFACNIDGHGFDLINVRKDGFYYFIIDCLEPIQKKEFQKKCYNTLLGIALLKGDLVLNESYLLTFDDSKLKEPKSIEYTSMRSSVFSNQPLITTNPFSVRIFDEDFERDEKGMISESQRKKLYEGIVDVSSDVFSKLVTLFCEEEKVQRAALLYILGHKATLEIRIPNYYVALEAITSYLSRTVMDSSKKLNPIKDKKIANDLIEEIKILIQDKKEQKGLTDEEINIQVLFKNVDRLNSPPNADKLAKSFEIIGYGLTSEQFKMIKDRNSYLHGSFIKTESEEERFRDALHLSLRLHFLIGVLLLKQVGYDGKIINYAKLLSHITGKEIDEEVLININEQTNAV